MAAVSHRPPERNWLFLADAALAGATSVAGFSPLIQDVVRTRRVAGVGKDSSRSKITMARKDFRANSQLLPHCGAGSDMMFPSSRLLEVDQRP